MKTKKGKSMNSWLEKTVLKVKTDNLLLKKNGKVTKD